MKLVLYTPRFYPLVGGLERVTMAWANALQNMGHVVSVITATPYHEEDTASYKIFRNISFAMQVRMFKNADAVLCMNISLKVLPLLLLARKPLLVSHHTLLTDGKYRFQFRQQAKLFLCNKLARVNICCSAFVAKPLRNTVVVHSPYDASIFCNQHLKKSSGSLLFVGRLVSDKGVQVLLDAFAKAKTNYPRQLTLTICGDGPERIALESVVASAGLQHAVQFIGVVTPHETANLMNMHEVLIVPSVVEPFGTVVPEGLACGCKVIASNIGGLPEAAGGMARLVPAANATALAAAIMDAILQTQRPNSEQLAAHLQALSITTSATKIADTLCSVLQKK